MTECPYCGERLRKRAPKLRRDGDEIKVQEGRRERKLRKQAERAERAQRRRLRMPDLGGDGFERRSVVTIGLLAIAAVLLIAQRAIPLFIGEAGAIIGPLGDEYWRYLTAPFLYDDLGALIAVGAVIAIFGTALERRLGSLAVAVMVISTGSLGALAAVGVGSLVVAGGNGVALGLIAAWAVLARAGRDPDDEDYRDFWGAAAAASVMLLLPLVEATADPIAGVAGGLVGGAFGAVAVWRAGRGAGS